MHKKSLSKDGFTQLQEESSLDIKKKKSSKKEEPSGGFVQYVKKKVEEKIMDFLHKQKPIVQAKIKDKHMPSCVQNFVDDLVEENWPVLEEEVQYQLRIQTDIPFTEITKPDVSACCWICWKIRSILKYSYMPVDKSLGQLITNPLWLIQTIASLCPIYGVSSFYYIFLFLIIDKSDEFQLIHFILSFKRFQFFAFGIIGGFAGFLMYFNCADQNTNVYLSTAENCHLHGPSMLIHPRIDLASFGVNILLVWITLVFLPCSEQKGTLRFKIAEKEEEKQIKKKEKRKLNYEKKREKIVKKIEEKVEKMKSEGKKAKFEDFVEEYKLDVLDDLNRDLVDHPQKPCCSFSRGGAMKCLIFFDMLSFALAVFFFYSTYKLENKHNFEEAKGHIFFTKWIYAILGFPFLLFSIPLVSSLLSRARPTAYDVYGNTVPVIGELTYLDDDFDDDLAEDLEDEEQFKKQKN